MTKRNKKILPGKLYKFEPYHDLGCTVVGLAEKRGMSIKILPHEIVMFIKKEKRKWNYHFLTPDGTRIVVELSMKIENWHRIEEAKI